MKSNEGRAILELRFAVKRNRIEEFINVISDNPGMTLQEFSSKIYTEELVEITDD